MPGGGKSSIGKLLARRLVVTFLDVDATIEQRVGDTIASVFEDGGEAAFRRRESEVLADLVQRGGAPAVVATGGGVVLSAANRELLRNRTVPIYLFAPVAKLWRRVRTNTRRPLLRVADPYARLCELFDQRDPLYREVARIVVETGRSPMRSIVDDIVAQLEQAGILSPGGGPTADGDRSRALP